MDMDQGLALLLLLAMTAGCIFAFVNGWPPGPGGKK